jgi:hypothetical protein
MPHFALQPADRRRLRCRSAGCLLYHPVAYFIMPGRLRRGATCPGDTAFAPMGPRTAGAGYKASPAAGRRRSCGLRRESVRSPRPLGADVPDPASARFGGASRLCCHWAAAGGHPAGGGRATASLWRVVAILGSNAPAVIHWPSGGPRSICAGCTRMYPGPWAVALYRSACRHRRSAGGGLPDR